MKMNGDKCPLFKKVASKILYFIVQRYYVYNKDRDKTKRIIYTFIPENWDKGIADACMRILNTAKEGAEYYWEISMSLNDKCLPVEIFGEGKHYLFEDTEFICPQDSHTYLKNIYGEDYMVVPKVEDRVDHGDLIVDLNQDYSYYQSLKGQ